MKYSLFYLTLEFSLPVKVKGKYKDTYLVISMCNQHLVNGCHGNRGYQGVLYTHTDTRVLLYNTLFNKLSVSTVIPHLGLGRTVGCLLYSVYHVSRVTSV